jgi:hypothetical protein
MLTLNADFVDSALHGHFPPLQSSSLHQSATKPIESADPLVPAPASDELQSAMESATIPPPDNSQSFQEVGAAPDKMDVPYTKEEAERKGAEIGRSIGLGIRHAGEAVIHAAESAAHAVGIGHADSASASAATNTNPPQ